MPSMSHIGLSRTLNAGSINLVIDGWFGGILAEAVQPWLGGAPRRKKSWTIDHFTGRRWVTMSNVSG